MATGRTPNITEHDIAPMQEWNVGTSGYEIYSQCSPLLNATTSTASQSANSNETALCAGAPSLLLDNTQLLPPISPLLYGGPSLKASRQPTMSQQFPYSVSSGDHIQQQSWPTTQAMTNAQTVRNEYEGTDYDTNIIALQRTIRDNEQQWHPSTFLFQYTDQTGCIQSSDWTAPRLCADQQCAHSNTRSTQRFAHSKPAVAGRASQRVFDGEHRPEELGSRVTNAHSNVGNEGYKVIIPDTSTSTRDNSRKMPRVLGQHILQSMPDRNAALVEFYQPMHPLCIPGDDCEACILRENVYVAGFLDAINHDLAAAPNPNLSNWEWRLRQQGEFNYKSNDQKKEVRAMYSDRRIGACLRLLFAEIVDLHQGTDKPVYANTGDSARFGIDSSLICSARLALITTKLKYNKRIVIDVIESRGVKALVRDPVSYENRKLTNDTCNKKKSQERKRARITGRTHPGSEDETFLQDVSSSSGAPENDIIATSTYITPNKRPRQS